MDFSDLKDELADRGFSEFTDTRRGRLINAARAELDRLKLWPWREKSVTGTSPVTVTDLGRIEAVLDTTNNNLRLTLVDFNTLTQHYGDVGADGTPWAYYTARPAGDPVVATYPSNSNTIGVQYWKVTPDLVDDSDEPASPDEAHYTIVDLAVRRASKDADRRAQAQQEVNLAVAQLEVQYPPGVADGGMILPLPDWNVW